jgi:UPF0716 family protein affecting phage T7 exclusion
MRLIFSLVGLLMVVAIVGVLAKKQLSAATPANISEQSKQMQTQVKDQVNEATKAAAEAREKALDSGNSDKPVDKTGSAY